MQRRQMSRQVQGYCSMVVRAARYFSRASDRTLSRTERRMLERKHRNREKRKSRIEHSSNRIAGKKYRQMFNGEEFYSFFSNSKRLENLTESLIPRLPGRNVSFTHKSLWMALGFRLPLFMLIAYGITNENVSPYVIQGSLGPSMLPTIQFVGDIWLVETGAWHRALRWALRQLGQEKLAVESMYEIGDMVIWEDTNTGKRSCKRIIGLEGDTVYRFGQYRNLYRNRADVGILWPKEENAKQIFGAFSGENEEYNVEGNGEISQTVIVPNQCVWLEGDCPLFSMDSRQYGPIHNSKIRGRLAFRLWPWKRDDLMSDEANSYLSSCWISKKRPLPYSSPQDYIGKRFGLYRIQTTSNNVHFSGK